MDFSKYDTRAQEEQGAFLHLEGPNGDKLWSETEPREPVGITLLGIHSRKIRALEHRQQNKRLASTRVGRRGQIRGLTSEQVEENALEILQAATMSFHHIIVDGELWEADRASEFYERFPWVREQVDEFINTEANFLGEA